MRSTMKKLLPLLLLICVDLFGCNFGYAKTNDLIYQTFFKNIVRVNFFKVSPASNIDVSSPEVINLIKEEMTNSAIIKKYSSRPEYGGIFKNESYRLLLIVVKIADKKYKGYELLYSSGNGIMIARESDIISGVKEKLGEKITVYEFKIPEKVNKLLKKHEEELPEDGFFLNTWNEKFE
jgi:hypothetical protein